jgi:cytochrome P450
VLTASRVTGYLRGRVIAWAARRYLRTGGGGGLTAAQLSMLPDNVLWPLHRDGLDPVAELGRRRAAEPVSRLPVAVGVKVWLVTGYDEVRAVLGSTDGFSNDFGRLAAGAGVDHEHDPGGLGFADPPAHTRLRRLLTPEFTMRRLARLQPRIEAIVAGQLDEMAAAGDPVDLWTTFALPIPSLTICELLGVPYDEREEFQQRSTARFDLGAGAHTPFDTMTQSITYLLDLVARQRKEPGDGLLGAIVRDHGDEIDDRELAGLADGVLTGGLETSASMLALGALVLTGQPEVAERVRAGTGVDQFVEELLRYLTVVQVAFPRFALTEMTLGGVSISPGDVVICSLSAADRDEALGDGAERFDPSRPPRPHLAFGHGIHRCVGAELARMELRTAYPALMRRFPAMRLAVPEADLPFRRASIVYGVESLPVSLR